MIIEIKQGNKTFVTSAALLFGLRKEDDMFGWTPTPKTEYATKATMTATRDLLLETGYKDAAAALDNAIELIAAACAEQNEQDRLAETITAEAQELYFEQPAQLDRRTTNAMTANSYDHHLQHGFTESERAELHQWWNNKYGG